MIKKMVTHGNSAALIIDKPILKDRNTILDIWLGFPFKPMNQRVGALQ